MIDGRVDASAVVAVAAGHHFAPLQLTGESLTLSSVRLLSPVLPNKVVCIGQHYDEHAAAMGGGPPQAIPVGFLTPSTSVLGPDESLGQAGINDEVRQRSQLALA